MKSRLSLKKQEQQRRKQRKRLIRDSRKEGQKAAFADRKDNRKGDFRGGFRRDSNPDVIYGRDFEGEPVALETITGEMGEVMSGVSWFTL